MSNDNYVTPLELTRELPSFDFDPCMAVGQPWRHAVGGTERDGLTTPWPGRVWLNPPYSKPYDWMCRIAMHGNGIALMNVAVSTKWWREWVWPHATAIRFLSKRIRFYVQSDTAQTWVPATRPNKESVLIAYGLNNAACLLALPNEGITAGYTVVLRGNP